MRRILCYGDSNTFGTNPSGGRWQYDQRWTGILSSLLGPDFQIIEEGLGGRTTVFDDPLELHRSGREFLPVALHSHRPLDLVILSLGTNDCKKFFNADEKIIEKPYNNWHLSSRLTPMGRDIRYHRCWCFLPFILEMR
ncbi:MAG: GDSL-type esterase/lipase family protein [Sphaerochaeta sp.]|nr:GDSL-type esterase/lipase family protein [Sphaerochaeta sp.]